MTNETYQIDDALDRLVAACSRAGLEQIRRPSSGVDQVLARIEQEIAPLRLPEELRRFWRAVDPASIRVAPYPRITTSEFALDSWKSHQHDFPGMTPRLLFPIAYESHGFLFIELEDGHDSGGPVLEWAYAGSPFYVRFAALSDYVDLLATFIESGEFVRHDLETHSWIEFDPTHRWMDALTVRLAALQPLPSLGDAWEIDEDIRNWPEHWLRSNGLTPETRTPRGATTTIAALLQRSDNGESVTGTIHGLVTSLAGTSAGLRIAVDDGTGVLDLWCPANVCTYGPTMRRRFEFDVTVQAQASSAPDWRAEQREVQRHALSHRLQAAQQAARELYAKAFDAVPDAQAIAVRALD